LGYLVPLTSASHQRVYAPSTFSAFSRIPSIGLLSGLAESYLNFAKLQKSTTVLCHINADCYFPIGYVLSLRYNLYFEVNAQFLYYFTRTSRTNWYTSLEILDTLRIFQKSRNSAISSIPAPLLLSSFNLPRGEPQPLYWRDSGV